MTTDQHEDDLIAQLSHDTLCTEWPRFIVNQEQAARYGNIDAILLGGRRSLSQCQPYTQSRRVTAHSYRSELMALAPHAKQETSRNLSRPRRESCPNRMCNVQASGLSAASLKPTLHVHPLAVSRWQCAYQRAHACCTVAFTYQPEHDAGASVWSVPAKSDDSLRSWSRSWPDAAKLERWTATCKLKRRNALTNLQMYLQNVSARR
jgi:hypothetical protein